MSFVVLQAIAVIMLASAVILVKSDKVRYDHYRVYSLKVETPEKLSVLQKLETFPDGVLFLVGPSLSQDARLVVPPHKFANVTELFNEHRIQNEILTENLQSLIDDEQPVFTPRSRTFDWQVYHDLEIIYEWLDQQIETFPDKLTGYVVGKSFEGRDIRAVKLSYKPGNPTIFIESTIHAREWITVATATYLLNQLLRSNDSGIVHLAQNFDWVIVPVLNVDGYVYTHTTNRLWRKTRSRTTRFCTGVDANRNFDAHFGGVGTSGQPCSETYRGPYAFSEPETLALSRFIGKFDVKLYVSFHSYGQLLLFPYGHTHSPSPHHNDLMRIGQNAAKAISQRYGTKYVVGSIANAIYEATGGSIDWTYATKKIPLSFTFEFRDTFNGRFGFLLPAQYIVPNSEEVIDGLKAMIQESQTLRYL